MVAPKKRGGRAGPASKKAAVTAAEPEKDVQEDLDSKEVEAADTETPENDGAEAAETMDTEETTSDDNKGKTDEENVVEENKTGETKTDEKPAVEKVVIEPGRILVENLPSSLLFTFKEHLTELFSKHGEVASVKRGSINVTELTTTPTLSAIVEFKNKESLEKAITEHGTVIDKSKIVVTIEPNNDTTVVVGVPNETSIEYIRLLLSECGEILRVTDHTRGKFKTLLVVFKSTDAVEKSLKLDRELRINGFVVTVTKHKSVEDNKSNDNKGDKRNTQNAGTNNANNQRGNTGGGGYRGNRTGNSFNSGFRGGRGGGMGYGGAPRGGGMFGAATGGGYAPPYGGRAGGYAGGYMNDGQQRPMKRMRM